MVWTDVALKTGEMLMSSSSVIQLRTQRMATAGLAPNANDIAEFQLMGQEKLDAASESGAAPGESSDAIAPALPANRRSSTRMGSLPD
jgi:hypothetical protein